MNKLKMSVCAIIAYVALVVGFGIAASPSATGQGGQGQGNGQPPGKDVRVINGASEPVPVSGQVAVTSLPAIQIGSLPAVQLDTTQPIPVEVTGQTALQPFAKEASVFTTLSQGSGSFTVPAGKRLYIETISVRGSVPQGHVPFTDMDVTTGGEQIAHPLPITLRGFDGVLSDQYIGLHEVRIVADAGSTVQFRAFRRAGGGTMALGMTISGHLMDL